MAEPIQRSGRSGWWFWYQDPTRPAGKRWRLKRGGDTKKECWTSIIATETELQPVKLGLITAQQYHQQKNGSRPIDDVLKDFESHLGGRKRTSTHVKTTMNCIRKIATTCGFHTLADIDAVRVEGFLSDLLKINRSSNTRNRYRASIMQLMIWAMKRGMIPANPLVVIEKLEEGKDKRRPSRAMTVEQFWKLIDVTKKNKRGGAMRALYYWLAGRAGLRWQEIARLRRRHLDLGDTPALVLDASITKNGRDSYLIIDADLAEEIRTGMPDGDVLFPTSPTLKTWKDDLSRAGIISRVEKVIKEATETEDAVVIVEYPDYKTSEGQFDRKSIRTMYCTHMYEAGVDIRDAQERMRHSDINLTAKVYTRIRLQNQQAAADSLRRPAPAPIAKDQAKTG